MSNTEEEQLGSRFWLWVLGVTFGAVGAAVLVGLIFGLMANRWGWFGGLVGFFGVVLLIAYIYDRRKQRKYEELGP